MRQLVLHNTNACNLQCKHCFRDFDKNCNIDTTLLSSVLPDAIKIGYDSVVFTGGEPCMHPEFKKQFDIIVEHGMGVSIVSNGFNLDGYKFIADYKKHINFVAFSLDGSTASTHDTQRNKDGVFDSVLESAKWMVEQGISVRFTMCISKINQHQIEDVYALAKSVGVNDMIYISVISCNHGSGKTNSDLLLSNAEKDGCVSRINKMYYSGIKPNIIYTASLNDNASASERPLVEFCSSLNLDYSPAITINPSGEVVMCCDLVHNGISVGSLKNNTFIDLYYKVGDMQDRLKKLRRKMIASGEYVGFAGFNSCEFCNTYITKEEKENKEV